MKRTLTINLGGQVFYIDEDAYEELKAYLTRIEVHFSDPGERKEVLDDIERRMAELLQEKDSDKNRVVTQNDMREMMNTLGDPDEIGKSGEETSSQTEARQYRSSSYKRIYRNPDDRILGGVCGGLGAYFNINPLLFRILFIIFTFVGGSGLLVYIILWIVVPEARTRAQKMEMRGEPVTIENLGKTVREEFNEVRNNFKKTK